MRGMQLTLLTGCLDVPCEPQLSMGKSTGNTWIFHDFPANQLNDDYGQFQLLWCAGKMENRTMNRHQSERRKATTNRGRQASDKSAATQQQNHIQENRMNHNEADSTIQPVGIHHSISYKLGRSRSRPQPSLALLWASARPHCARIVGWVGRLRPPTLQNPFPAGSTHRQPCEVQLGLNNMWRPEMMGILNQR